MWFQPGAFSLLSAFVWLFAGLVISYGIGFYSFRLAGVNERISVFSAHFFRLAAGLQFITTVYAISVAGTHTLQIFVPVLILAVWLFRKQFGTLESEYTAYTPERNKKPFYIAYLYIGGSALLFFIWWWGSITHFGKGLYMPFWDHVFYSRIATILTGKGFEAKKLAALFEDNYMQTVPYHYSELWITALFSKLSGIPDLLAYELLTIPLLETLVGLAVLAFVERFTKITLITLLFSFAAVFYFGVALRWYGQIVKLPRFFGAPEVQSLNMYPKQLIIYVWFGTGLLLNLYGYRVLGLVALMMAALSYSVILPAVFGGIGIYLVWRLLVKKDFTYSYPAGFMLLITVGIAVFYGVINKSKEVDTLSKFLFLYPNPIIHIKGLFIVVINYSLLFFDALLAVWIFSGKNAWKKLAGGIPDFVVYVLIAGVGYIVSAVTFGFVDNTQFFNLVMSPVIYFAVLRIWVEVVFVSARIDVAAWKKGAAATLFVLLAFLNMYQITTDFTYPKPQVNEAFMKTVCMKLQTSEAGPLGAFIDTANNTAQVTELRYLGSELLYYRSENVVAGLTVFDDLAAGIKDNENLFNFAKEDIFYRFTERQKKAGTFKSVAESQTDFIKDRKIDYLFVSGKVSMDKYPAIKTSITYALHDSLNNNYFYLIDRSKL